MGILYLVHRKLSQEALALAKEDREAQVVLLQDAVYLDSASFSMAKVYALKWDADIRDMTNRLPRSVKLISYQELVDLLVDNKVVNLT